MNLESQLELEVTREKLSGLELVYAATLAEPGEKTYARELTLRSLKRTINQLKEEIARFEAHAGSTIADQ
jgi:CobQ-like glutamine amidotransferase family enzyme